MAKAGKWEGLKKKVKPDGTRMYPDNPFTKLTDSEKPGFAAAVMAAKAGYSTLAQEGLIAVLGSLERKMAALSEAWDECKAGVEAVDQLLVADFEARGIRSLNTAAGRTLYLSMEPRVKVLDKEKVKEWCSADPGKRHIIQYQPQSLASWVKGELEEGRDSEVEKEFLEITLVTAVRSKQAP